MRALARQFSTPDGIPSHVSVPTPGSIHEGGELGYALIHAFGAAMDHPDLLVACVVGDGEAETGPLEGSWKGTRFINPRRDGAVLPILHLNSYKIANPTVLGRTDPADVRNLLHAHGYEVFEVTGSDVDQVHRDMAATLEEAHARIRAIWDEARAPGAGPLSTLPRWPAIVLRTPKGWTGPKEVDGIPIEGTFRAHQVPLSRVRENPKHLKMLENWLLSYEPDRLFDSTGRLVPELAELAPAGDLRMGSTPYANGGRLTEDLHLPDWRKYAFEVDPERRGSTLVEPTWAVGKVMRDLYVSDPHTFRVFSPDELTSNRLGDVLDVSDRCLVTRIDPLDDRVSPEGRVMEVLSEHLCQGWLEGYTLSGRHGLFATYEAFAMVSASMLVQHAKWLQEAEKLSWRVPVPSLNVLLTSTCWRNDHNGFSHQGPGLLDTVIPLGPGVVRAWLPPDGNCLLSIADHCFKSRNHVNLIVADKQPHHQYLTADEAAAHCERGGSVWDWAGTEIHHSGSQPDIVLACIGDVPTMELLAAAQLLREWVPDLITRVVNVVDLMALMPQEVHPHGFSDTVFRSLFGTEEDVLVAFHGYAPLAARAAARAAEPAAFPYPRVPVAGHHDDPVRHGGAQRDEPLSPCAAGTSALPAAASRFAGTHRLLRQAARATPCVRARTLRGFAGDQGLDLELARGNSRGELRFVLAEDSAVCGALEAGRAAPQPGAGAYRPALGPPSRHRVGRRA